MRSNAAPMTAVLGLLAALASGCASQVESSDAPPAEAAQLELGHGGQHPGCAGFRQACREGNQEICALYSQQCEVRIGVIGDSLSDEYQGSVALPGVQWTEQVQAGARISLGTLETHPAVRGEPRNTGYSQNWARFGQAALGIQWNDPEYQQFFPDTIKNDPRLATIGSFDAQIHGLGAQIAAGEVDVAVVWVGHNDLFIRQYIGFVEGSPEATYGALITRIVTAAATLRGYATAEGENPKAKIAIMGLAGDASALNPSLSSAAASAGIAFIDPFNTAVTQIVTEQATTGFYTVGGTPLQPFDIVLSPFSATATSGSLLDLSPPSSEPPTGPCGFSPLTSGIACSTPSYAEAFRHYDGIHPNTLYMGVVGNQTLTALNDTFGFAMQTISEDQLLDTAGL